VEGNDPHRDHGRVCEGDRARVRVGHGVVEVTLLCFRWLSPSFLMAQAIFEPKLFPYYTPTFLKPNSFYTHLPAYEDGTESVF